MGPVLTESNAITILETDNEIHASAIVLVARIRYAKKMRLLRFGWSANTGTRLAVVHH
jgi:hypothetical protein